MGIEVTAAAVEELMTGVAVPLLLALLQLEDELELVDRLEQEPMEQQEAEEEEDDVLDEEFEEAGLSRLRSLFGLATPS